jgi:uncharacterized membrane protein YdbT with pleckstrin-like domain
MTQALAKTNIVAIGSASQETAQPARALSMTRSAIRSRERNAEKKAEALATLQAEQEAQAAAEQKAREEAQAAADAERLKMQAAMRKAGAGRIAAAIAAAFLPIASFVLAHIEAPTNPALWVLVAAALLFSAPTLVQWAAKWCGSMYKAMGFAGLLEGVMVFSHIPALAYAGLAILVMINAVSAWGLAGKAQALDM